jgi:hypothetical protein
MIHSSPIQICCGEGAAIRTIAGAAGLTFTTTRCAVLCSLNNVKPIKATAINTIFFIVMLFYGIEMVQKQKRLMGVDIFEIHVSH